MVEDKWLGLMEQVTQGIGSSTRLVVKVNSITLMETHTKAFGGTTKLTDMVSTRTRTEPLMRGSGLTITNTEMARRSGLMVLISKVSIST
jgi:hypothetical protein